MGEEGVNVHVGERVGPFVVVASEWTIPARKRRVVVRCVACERVSEMNERSLLDKRTEGQRACAKCRVYVTNGTWTKGWRSKMENAAIEANRLNKENADLRDEIDKVLRERDEARAAEEHLRGQHQYSVGLSMALEERDQARRERDLSRQAEERARESLEELDAAIYECLPGDDDDSPLDCVERAGDKLRELAQDRDEWRDKFLALNQTAGEICNACGWAFKIPGEPCRCEVVKERDEARAEVLEYREQLRKLPDANRIASQDAYRRGAEAMRVRCEEIARHACSVIGKLEHTYGIMTQGHIETVSRLILETDIPEEP